MAISYLFLLLLVSLFSLYTLSTGQAPMASATMNTFDHGRATTTTTAASPPHHAPEVLDNSFFSHTVLLAPVLSHLGFTELAMAAPSLSSETSSTTAWSGPSTLFAPSDSSIRTCYSCSVPSLLREHIVPGLFKVDYLRKLAFGTKIETLSPGRCITVTSSMPKNVTSPNEAKVFIGGVEITHPDLFNNGLIVIHGIQGYVSPLSPFSCDVERMTSLSFPFQPADRHSSAVPGSTTTHQLPVTVQPAIMRLMLRDAILRLRNNGFSILSLAMKVKYAELVALNNMTIFALDDVSIFSGSHSYLNSVRFHIIPNHYLAMGDLERLPAGTTMPSLEQGQSLVITTSGIGGLIGPPLRINYVRVKVPDVIRNLKIAVHSVYLPFPRIHPTTAVFDGILGGSTAAGNNIHTTGDHHMEEGACAVLDEHGACDDMATTVGLPPMSQTTKTTLDIEDHHGL
ncbi:hypothetical protein ACFE04_029647 [Oxalis oulophora]